MPESKTSRTSATNGHCYNKKRKDIIVFGMITIGIEDEYKHGSSVNTQIVGEITSSLEEY